MTSLSFEVIGARAEPHAAVPTIVLRLRVNEASATPVHTVVLRCQVRIEPQRRLYGDSEAERLYELFGERSRWGDSLRPFLWTHTTCNVPAFRDRTEVDLHLECTYDFEVAASKYLHALRDGEIPLVLLFSGTIFSQGPGGVQVLPVGWEQEARFGLPAPLWHEVMDLYFPSSAWIRIGRDTLDALARFKAGRALATWDQTVGELLDKAAAIDAL